jgi:hypothetical protein
MIAALFAVLVQLLASWADQPAPVVPPAVVAPAPAPGVSPSLAGQGRAILPGVSGSQPGPAAPTVATPPAPEDYPAQSPEEAVGGARCGDGPQVVVSIAPDGTPVCG